MRRFKTFDDFYTFILGIFNSFQFVFPDQDGYDNFMQEIIPVLKDMSLDVQFPSQSAITCYLSFCRGSVVLGYLPLPGCANYKIVFTKKSISVSFTEF